jgi:hypothetical protein
MAAAHTLHRWRPVGGGVKIIPFLFLCLIMWLGYVCYQTYQDYRFGNESAGMGVVLSGSLAVFFLFLTCIIAYFAFRA